MTMMPHRAHGRFDFSPGGTAVPGMSELTNVGYNIWSRHQPHELGGHSHSDQWEIHYVVHGQILEEVAGHAHVMTSGDVMIAAPGVVHTGMNRVRHRCGVCWLGIRLPPRGALPGLSTGQTRLIREGFQRLGSTPFPGDPALLPACAGLLEQAHQPSSPAQLLLCRSYLHLILALVMRPAASVLPVAIPRTPAVAAAATILAANLGSTIRIADLSPQVGLRHSALNQRFVAEMGVTPAAYRMQARLEEAKRLLGSSSNAVVAQRLCFASPQHFVTMFRRAFGVTPGRWRKRLLAAQR
jgi:AraC-like DNA-binding protein